jgi:hypothetical protein
VSRPAIGAIVLLVLVGGLCLARGGEMQQGENVIFDLGKGTRLTRALTPDEIAAFEAAAARYTPPYVAPVPPTNGSPLAPVQHAKKVSGEQYMMQRFEADILRGDLARYNAERNKTACDAFRKLTPAEQQAFLSSAQVKTAYGGGDPCTVIVPQ